MENFRFCETTVSVWQALGYLYKALKICVPAILIILCVFLIGKAIFTHDEKESKKIWKSILWKIILAILIFLVPAIVGAIFNFVNGFKEIKSDYSVCKSCIMNPESKTCKKAMEEFENSDAE